MTEPLRSLRDLESLPTMTWSLKIAVWFVRLSGRTDWKWLTLVAIGLVGIVSCSASPPCDDSDFACRIERLEERQREAERDRFMCNATGNPVFCGF